LLSSNDIGRDVNEESDTRGGGDADARSSAARNAAATHARSAMDLLVAHDGTPSRAGVRLGISNCRMHKGCGARGRSSCGISARFLISSGRMMGPMRDVSFYRWEDMPKEEVTALLDRRLVTGDRMMLAHVYLKKGCVVPKHRHENEQITYILEGALHFWIGEEEAREVTVRAGEVLHIPSMVWHKAEALEDTLDVDVFDPPRQDWLDKTDDYLRR
jgi:unsaturated pyranuronate lyase